MTAEFVLSELQSVGSPEKAAHLSRFFKTGPGQYGEGDRFLGGCRSANSQYSES